MLACHDTSPHILFAVAGEAGIEPATSAVTMRRSTAKLLAETLNLRGLGPLLDHAHARPKVKRFHSQ